jgi:hypothetical protein
VIGEAWAASGAMWLTGRAGGPPLDAPDGVVAAIAAIGERAGVDALQVLGERAAIAGFARRGATSCGGSTRLLRTGDGEAVAVALARPDDGALLPAWLGVPAPRGGAMGERTWEELERALATCCAHDVVGRAVELGLAAARRGEVGDAPLVVATPHGDAPPLARPPLVVDLSSLWAGPLTTRLLQRAGARVIKVESTARPDGARRGDPRFFDLMHAGKESVALDFTSPEGVDQLRRVLRAADVVVEASRPRALTQLGIDAHDMVVDGTRVWCSITGYGRAGANAIRVAFGDDAAVAGGLVADDGETPCFVADAVADPLTGMVAAAAVLDALRGPSRVLLDVALARVAGAVAASGRGAAWRAGDPSVARRPVAPPITGRAPVLGEHTAAVLREFGA